MKNFYLSLFAMIILLSCNKHSEYAKTNESGRFQKVEEYAPGISKQVIETPSGLSLQKIDSVYILEGDIVLSTKQIDALEKPITKGGILGNTWPDGVVYYELNPQGRRPDARINALFQAAVDAMNYYNKNTGVEFRVRTFGSDPFGHQIPQQYDYISIIIGEGSWSYLGKIGGGQQVCLDYSWADVGTAIHELGHAIGLLHEQCRSDRDNYININYSNIVAEQKHNFDKSTQSYQLTSTFDFNSIMLYSSYNNFAIDWSEPTMTRKDGSTWDAQRSYLSEGDLAAIKMKYPNPPCNKILTYRPR